MLPDYAAYLAAQRCEERVAHGALPDAPVRPTDPARAPGGRLAEFRAWLSTDLRRLADRLEPVPRPHVPASAHRQ